MIKLIIDQYIDYFELNPGQGKIVIFYHNQPIWQCGNPRKLGKAYGKNEIWWR